MIRHHKKIVNQKLTVVLQYGNHAHSCENDFISLTVRFCSIIILRVIVTFSSTRDMSLVHRRSQEFEGVEGEGNGEGVSPSPAD